MKRGFIFFTLVLCTSLAIGQEQGLYAIKSNESFFKSKLQVDSFGNIYNLHVNENGETILTKINACGTKLWSKSIAGAKATGKRDILTENIQQLYVGKSVYVVLDQSYSSIFSGGYRYIVHCFTSQGKYQWSKILPYNPYKQILKFNAFVDKQDALNLFYYDLTYTREAYMDSLHYNVVRFGSKTGEVLAQKRFDEANDINIWPKHCSTPIIKYNSAIGSIEIIRIGGIKPEKLLLRYNDLAPVANYTQNIFFKNIQPEKTLIDQVGIYATIDTDIGRFSSGFDSLFLISFKKQYSRTEYLSLGVINVSPNGAWLLSQDLTNVYSEYFDFINQKNYRILSGVNIIAGFKATVEQLYDVIKGEGLIYNIMQHGSTKTSKAHQFEVIRPWTNTCNDTLQPNWLLNSTDTIVFNWQKKDITIGKPFNFKDTVFVVKEADVKVVKLCSPDTWLPSDFLPNDTIICNNSFVINPQLDSIKAKFLWSTGDTNTTIKVDSSAYYYLSLSNGFCTVTDSVHITFLNKTIEQLNESYTICKGDSLALNVENSAYFKLITSSSDTLFLDSLNPKLYIKELGKYQLKTINTTPCTLDFQFTLKQSNVSITLPSDTIICPDSSIYLSLDTNYTSYWYVNGLLVDSLKNIYQIKPKTDTIISVKLIDSFSCQASDTMQVKSYDVFSVDFALDSSYACIKDSFKIDIKSRGGKAPYQYFYNDSLIAKDSFKLSFLSNQIEPYKLVVKDACKQEFLFSTKLNYSGLPQLNIHFQGNDTLLLGSKISAKSLSSSANIKWYINDAFYALGDEITYTANDTGIYLLKAIANNQFCIDSALRKYYITQPFIYVPNVFSPSNDDVNEYWLPVCYKCQIVEYTIYNRWGQRIFSGDGTEYWSGRQKNGEVLPSDMYLAIIKYRDETGKHYIINSPVYIVN